MSSERLTKISKSLSCWLRHKPEQIGIRIENDGWVDVKELLAKASSKILFDFNELKQVVQSDDKKRYSFSEDFCMIRANQGHSVEVDIKFEEVIPPTILYHGTPNKNVESILKSGLNKGNRQYVHLSPDEKTAAVVGARRGEFTILKIEALKMRADKIKIYISENGVYLVDEVPKEYIKR